MLWVLDSTVLIDYLRGRPTVERVSALAETGDLLATTAINVEEIVRGLRPAEAGAATELFAGLEVLSVDLAAAWQAGEWRRGFSARGVTLWQADCLIAADRDGERSSAGHREPARTSPCRMSKSSTGQSAARPLN